MKVDFHSYGLGVIAASGWAGIEIVFTGGSSVATTVSILVGWALIIPWRRIAAWTLYWLGDACYCLAEWLDLSDQPPREAAWDEVEAWYQSTLWGRFVWWALDPLNAGYQYLMGLSSEVQGDGPGPWKPVEGRFLTTSSYFRLTGHKK